MSINTLEHVNGSVQPNLTPINPIVTPPFMRRIGALAGESGGDFAGATVEVLNDAGIRIEVEGDMSGAQTGGLVVASDHSQRIEPLLVQSLAAAAERPSSYVVAMPTSFAGILMQASGKHGRGLVVPVLPSGYGIKKASVFHDPRSAYRQSRYPYLTWPKEVKKQFNDGSIGRSSNLVAGGNMLTICPAGGAFEAAKAIWQSGLGRIILGIPAEKRCETQIAVARLDSFSMLQVMSALALRDIGLRPPKQEIILRAALLGAVTSIVPAEDLLARADDSAAGRRISSHIKGRYEAHFRQHIS